MKRKETINMDDKAHDIQIKSQKIKGASAILNAIGIISSKVIAVTVLFSNKIFGNARLNSSGKQRVFDEFLGHGRCFLSQEQCMFYGSSSTVINLISVFCSIIDDRNLDSVDSVGFSWIQLDSVGFGCTL